MHKWRPRPLRSSKALLQPAGAAVDWPAHCSCCCGDQGGRWPARLGPSCVCRAAALGARVRTPCDLCEGTHARL